MSNREERITNRAAIEEVFNYHAMIGVKDPHIIAQAVLSRAKEQKTLLNVPYLHAEYTTVYLAPGPEIGTCTVITKRHDPLRKKDIYSCEKRRTDDFMSEIYRYAAENRKRLESIRNDEELLSSMQEELSKEIISGAYTKKGEIENVEAKRKALLKDIESLYGQNVAKDLEDLLAYQKFVADFNRMTGDGVMAHSISDSREVNKKLQEEWAEDGKENNDHQALATYATLRAEQNEQGQKSDATGINMTRSTALDKMLKMLLRPQQQN